MTSMSREYFVRRGSKVNGPLTLPQVRSALVAKKLLISDEMSSAVDGPWNRVATVYKDVIDGREPRLLNERPPVVARKSAVLDRQCEDGPTGSIELPSDKLETDELNAAVEMESELPSLPPPLKRRPPQRPGVKSNGSNRWTLVCLAGAVCLGGCLFAANLLSSATSLINQQSSASPSNSGASASSVLIDSSGVTKQLTKIQRALGLNQLERDQLKKSIRKIESDLSLREISANTVFQQQVSRIDACIEMTSIITEALGAKSGQTKPILERLEQQDILSDTVFQQLAGHLSVYGEIMSLAAEKSGVPVTEIAKVQRLAELTDNAAETAQQQISARGDAVQGFAKLLAGQLGAPPQTLESLASKSALEDRLSDTVYQQMCARQAGVVKLLGAAAIAQGADRTRVLAIESEMDTDDIRVKTAQQQYAARIQRGFEMTTLLAEAIVLK